MGTQEPLVHEFVELQARVNPHACAVVGAGETVSYGELNRRANRLTHLLGQRGIGPERVVGLHLTRGPRLIVAMLAVLKAGGAYICLEPSHPDARVAHMLASAEVQLVIADAKGAARVRALGHEPLDVRDPRLREQSADDPGCRQSPDNLAYLIFTSGTTGWPKPVAIAHRSLRNHAREIANRFLLTRADSVLQFASPGFDVFAEEVFPTLHVGARLVLPPEPRLAVAGLERLVNDHRVTVANLPASYWTHWVRDLETGERRPPASLRLIVVGSEPVDTSTLLTWRRRCDVPVINAYGLSEATITVTTQRFDGDPPVESPTLPVGTPIRGAVAYVLDERMRQMPHGERGELYIGGEVLARGYPGLPAETAVRFMPDPFGDSPGGRLYRTGDVASIHPDGAIKLFGRIDDQVQVRGYRVEPAEVAAALMAHPGLSQACVLPLRDAPQRAHLVAYIVPSDPRWVPQPAALRAHLQTRLPAAMLPEAYVIMHTLPRAPSGKVDRAALPPADRGRRRATVSYVAPRTQLEAQLAEIWRDVVGVTEIGAYDDLFEIGGHSLTVLRVAAQIRDKFGVNVSIEDLFAQTTVARQARLVESVGSAASIDTLSAIVARPEARRAPLSSQQEQIWFLTRFAPDSIAYQTQTTIRVVGRFDLDVLDRVISEIERRHEILRTSYEVLDGLPRQVMHPPRPVRAQRVDLSELTGRERAARLDQIIEQELRRPFDITRLPLIRWIVIHLSPEEHELVLVEHHLLHDGWSFALLMRELAELYSVFAAGRDSPLPELPIQYRDYAVWQRASLEAPPMRAQLDYWLRKLSDLPPARAAVPADHPRPAVQSFRGEQLRVDLPVGLPHALREFSRAHRVTLFTTMLAGFFALMHRYTGQTDICVGSGFANRQVPRTEQLLGMFINTVVLRGDLSGNPSFAELVGRIGQTVLEAAAHEQLPFAELVRVLNPSREAGRNPLTQVHFSVNDAPIPGLDLADAVGTIFERGNGSAKDDLDIVVIPRAESQQGDAAHTDDRITLLWDYVVDLFDRPTMQRMVDGYLRLLADAVARPHARLSELALLSAEDRELATVAWNATDTMEGSLVPAAVAEQARLTPDALAIREGTRRVTYSELARLAGQLTHRLRTLGVGPEQVVGVCLPRSADLVIAELGILQAAAAYLPLDPDSPPARLAAQCADAGIRLVVSASRFAARLPSDVRPELLDRPTDPNIGAGPAGPARASEHWPQPRPDFLAYLISTSGSTGRPKTVMIDHRALANVVYWRCRACGLGPADRTTLISSPAFDGSVTDIWSPLVVGASVHIPDQDTRLDPARLHAWLLDEAISVTDLPSVLAERVLALPWPGDTAMRILIAAGDRLRARPTQALAFLVINEYGPTEVAVSATAGVVEPGDPEAPVPDIGRPIDGVTAYILDAWRQPVPVGAHGELWIGGVGVARGYRDRPGLTAENFVPDPFARRPGARAYRTGDLARHLPDGRIEFLGRRDTQIKLRGYRIEPDEIVSVLRGHPAIGAAVVVARADGPGGDLRLVAYIVPSNGSQPPPGSELREYVASRLPHYLVPSAFSILEALPLTRNGKLDLRALPPPVLEPPDLGHSAPTTELERLVATVWQQILGVERVGVDSNFFDLGGHSLLVAQVQRRLADLGHALPIVAFFEHPTINSLVRHLGDGAGQDVPADETLRGALRQAGRDRLQRRRERQRASAGDPPGLPVGGA